MEEGNQVELKMNELSHREFTGLVKLVGRASFEAEYNYPNRSDAWEGVVSYAELSVEDVKAGNPPRYCGVKVAFDPLKDVRLCDDEKDEIRYEHINGRSMLKCMGKVNAWYVKMVEARG